MPIHPRPLALSPTGRWDPASGNRRTAPISPLMLSLNGRSERSVTSRRWPRDWPRKAAAGDRA